MQNWVYRLLSMQDSSQKTYSVCKLSVSLLPFLHILMSLLIVLHCNVMVRHFFFKLGVRMNWKVSQSAGWLQYTVYQFNTLQSHNKLILTLFNSHFSFSFSTSPPKTLVLFESSIRKFSLTVIVPVKELLVPGGIDKLLRNKRNKHCSCFFVNLSKTCIFCSVNGFVFKCRHSWTLMDFLGSKFFGRLIGKFWLVFAIILFLSSPLHIISS